MAEKKSLQDQSRELADAMFDRQMDAQALQKLEELIATDIGCVQAYVERINFHGDMRRRAIEEAPLAQVASLMDKVVLTGKSRTRRQTWGYVTALVACVVLLLGVAAWMFSIMSANGPGIGAIANLTSDSQFGAESLDLGQIVREGEEFTVSTGIASVQLPSVMLDVIAPARVQLSDGRNLKLLSGAIHAQVRRGGEGFTVHTPDSVIVDLGTEFTVDYLPEKGTEVGVRRGRVQASLLDRSGQPVKQLNITAERAARFSLVENMAREVSYRSERFEQIDKTRGTIVSVEGTLRTLPEQPKSLEMGKQTTPNQMLVIPEQQNVVLEKDLHVVGLAGPVRIPAGSRISSYIIHYDPDQNTHLAPRGAVTFDGRIAAILVSADQLLGSDQTFGLPETIYDQSKYRELELDEDEIRISDDSKTASLYFGVAGGETLDQARLLIVSD